MSACCGCPDDGAAAWFESWSTTKTALACVVAVLLLVLAYLCILHRCWRRSAKPAQERNTRLMYQGTRELAKVRALGQTERYHLFLSHSWLDGQDSMRHLKACLGLLMLPELEIFLDVDNLCASPSNCPAAALAV
jgi:hypothetical protein